MYEFNAKKHCHTLNGKPLFGVTSVLKYWGDPNPLLNWGVKTAVDYVQEHIDHVKPGEDGGFWVIKPETLEEARTAHLKKRDKAGDKGTEVHTQLEIVLNTWIEYGYPPHDKRNVAWQNEYQWNEYSKPVGQVIYWMDEQNLTPLASEMNVWSEEMWTGGIIDGVVEKEGKKYILDFKTSGTVQTKYFYQLGAYAKMYEDSQNETIHGAIIVHIPRGQSFDPEKNVYFRYDIEELKQAFMNILNVYKLDQQVAKLLTY